MTEQLIEVADEVTVQDGRVEYDDKLFEILPKYHLRVESVRQEQAEGIACEVEENLESIGVVARMVQPATQGAEKQRDGIVTERIDEIWICSVLAQNTDATFDLSIRSA